MGQIVLVKGTQGGNRHLDRSECRQPALASQFFHADPPSSLLANQYSVFQQIKVSKDDEWTKGEERRRQSEAKTQFRRSVATKGLPEKAGIRR